MLNRRDFLSRAAALMFVRRARASVRHPQIAVTFDDPKTQRVSTLNWQDLNERILGTLKKRKLKSVLFVSGMRIDSDAGRKLVGAWDQDGHLIGNHSYSHLNLDEVTRQAFEADVLKNEPLVVSYRRFTRLLRYPYFKEGNTAEKRDGVRLFLKEHDYRIG